MSASWPTLQCGLDFILEKKGVFLKHRELFTTNNIKSKTHANVIKKNNGITFLGKKKFKRYIIK